MFEISLIFKIAVTEETVLVIQIHYRYFYVVSVSNSFSKIIFIFQLFNITVTAPVNRNYTAPMTK